VIKPIPIDRRIPYADNLARAINDYWRDTVAIPDGTRSTLDGSVHLPSRYGIPLRIISRWPHKTHPAIVRMHHIKGTNRWQIVDAEEQKRAA
jgi:hypothetical protein